MYMCSNCSALYCGNCAQALTDLKNACWVCNKAIDKSKSVKVEKEDDFEAKILDKVKK